MKLTPVADIEIGDELTVKYRAKQMPVTVQDTRNDHRCVVLTVESESGEVFDVSFPYDTLMNVRSVIV